MDEERARGLLADQRERVERLLADLARGDRDEEELSHADQHPADDAQFLADEEVDQGVAEQLREELEAIPWAERTAEEQTRYERGL